ncbi:MAG TPA: hypothetical protein VFT80_05060 [Actinomycetota bacterium]|nr:hypothetical protein [Actinomycetota bacterium]
MPEVQEVFRMATQKVRPDPGALERQLSQQRQRTIRRKTGAVGLVAVLVGVIAVVAVRWGAGSAGQVPVGQPSSPATFGPGGAPVGTVTFDGSTCSMEITADRIEPGVAVFEVFNATEQRAMFDTWELLDGYAIRAFERKIERDRQLAEAPGNRGTFPSDEEVRYLGSDIVPANSSEFIATTMWQGRHAIVCLQMQEGEPLRTRFRPFGVVGPIIVG